MFVFEMFEPFLIMYLQSVFVCVRLCLSMHVLAGSYFFLL